MTETILGLVPLYGLWVIALATFASCLALPAPSSLILLSAGGFAAAGDLVLWQAGTAALAGAVLGDQAAYGLARGGARRLAALRRRPPKPARAALRARAQAYLHDKGAAAVFFSRWLVSPIGPYVNYAAGAAGLGWGAFSRASLAGEVIWVTLYVGLGALFADDVVALAQILGNASGLLAALAAAGLLGLWLRAALRQRARR